MPRSVTFCWSCRTRRRTGPRPGRGSRRRCRRSGSCTGTGCCRRTARSARRRCGRGAEQRARTATITATKSERSSHKNPPLWPGQRYLQTGVEPEVATTLRIVVVPGRADSSVGRRGVQGEDREGTWTSIVRQAGTRGDRRRAALPPRDPQARDRAGPRRVGAVGAAGRRADPRRGRAGARRAVNLADATLQAVADTLIPGRPAELTDLGNEIHPKAIAGVHHEPGAVQADALAAVPQPADRLRRARAGLPGGAGDPLAAARRAVPRPAVRQAGRGVRGWAQPLKPEHASCGRPPSRSRSRRSSRPRPSATPPSTPPRDTR